MEQSKRIVLVEPGDVLIIGNTGELGKQTIEAIGTWADDIGIRVALFRAAVDLDVFKADRG